MLEDHDRNTGCGRVLDRLHDEDTAGRIGVVGKYIDDRISAGWNVHDVANGDRRRIVWSRGRHVDAHETGCLVRTVRHDIGEVVGLGDGG